VAANANYAEWVFLIFFEAREEIFKMLLGWQKKYSLASIGCSVGLYRLASMYFFERCHSV
jgi:hypothetical protein